MIPRILNFLEESVRLYPRKVAVAASGKTYTFSDLQEQSNNLAAYLQSLQIKRGDRAIVLLGNSIETIISFWAILKTGAIVIPVGIELKPNKIEYILKDSGASVLITSSEIVSQSKALLLSSGLKKVIIPNKPNQLSEALFTCYDTVVNQEKQELKASGLISIDLAAIIYTSGSTGEPKGVMLTHDNMIAATNSLNAYLKYQKDDKVLSALPLSFDYGLYQMIMCISTGATLLLEKEATWPIFLLKKIVKEKATIFPAVPTMIMLLYEQNKKYQFDLSSIRSVISMYGLTECKRCTYLPPEDIDKKHNSVGIAIPNTELWLVDDNDNKISNPNEIGQLVIRGATVMRGYWNKPEKTAEKLKQGKYLGEKILYTGDFCSMDKDGYLYFRGRMDHMIKSRGIKVSPKEVEDYIVDILGVKAVVVIGIPHDDYGEALFAFVVLNEGQSIVENDIITSCTQNLEAYKIPEYIEIITSIPKTPNGKFNVIALKEKALEIVKVNSKTVLTSL